MKHIKNFKDFLAEEHYQGRSFVTQSQRETKTQESLEEFLKSPKCLLIIFGDANQNNLRSVINILGQKMGLKYAEDFFVTNGYSTNLSADYGLKNYNEGKITILMGNDELISRDSDISTDFSALIEEKDKINDGTKFIIVTKLDDYELEPAVVSVAMVCDLR